MGAPREVLDTIAPAKNEFEIWDMNLPAVEFFLRLQTQWVVAGMGSYVGLNYQSVEFLFSILNIDASGRASLFDDLQDIEAGALAVLNAKSKG